MQSAGTSITKAQQSPRIVSKTVHSADGTPIFAEALGDPTKPSLVFVHGFGLSGLAFEGIFGSGEEGYTNWIDHVYLVRYDLRGHGRSGKPEDEASWKSERLAEDFDAVVRVFGLAKPFIVAWSLGGLTVADVLSRFPADYLSGAVVIAGFPYANSVYKICAPYGLSLIPPFLNSDSTDTLQAAAQSFVSAFTAPSSPPMPYVLQQAFMGNVLSQPRGCAKHVLTRTQEERGFWEAGKGGLPMLLINGDEDPFIDGTKTHNMASDDEPQSEWKDLTMHLVRGVGHMPFWEKPGEVREALLRFVHRVRKVA